MTDEREDIAAKRLRMRSWRRGMKEMDLILGPFADAEIASLAPAETALYERLLSENDQDLYAWVTAMRETPSPYAPLIARLRAFHGIEGGST